MRWLLILSFVVLSSLNLRADTYVYTSMAPEKKIQIFRLNEKDGSLKEVGAIAVDGVPGFLGVDPSRKHLFASVRSAGAIASFSIDQATGKLKLISTVNLGKGQDAAFVGTDRTGKWLISASYGGARVVIHQLDDDGSIMTPPTESVKTAVTAHSFATDPGNKWVFVPHVAPNAIFQFHFDATKGKLKDAGKAPGGKDNAKGVKAGPRHLAFHPQLKMAFTSDESGLSITSYAFDSEKGLKPVQTLSTLPEDYKKGGNSTADVKVHPNGRFVWVSNRGHDSLAGFAIDAAGKLTPLGQTPTEQTPRSFDIEPDGRFIFAAGEGNGKLAVFRVNQETGTLTRIHTYTVGKSLPSLVVVKIAAR